MSVLHDSPRLAENDLAFVVWDTFPIAPGHALVCTKREVASWFDITPEEQQAIHALASAMRSLLNDSHKPTGFVVMINDGKAQHIPHVHLHLIPYYREEPGGPMRFP